jgi:hypothetical protein
LPRYLINLKSFKKENIKEMMFDDIETINIKIGKEKKKKESNVKTKKFEEKKYNESELKKKEEKIKEEKKRIEEEREEEKKLEEEKKRIEKIEEEKREEKKKEEEKKRKEEEEEKIFKNLISNNIEVDIKQHLVKLLDSENYYPIKEIFKNLPTKYKNNFDQDVSKFKNFLLKEKKIFYVLKWDVTLQFGVKK